MKLIHGGTEAEPLDGKELADILDTLPRATQLCTGATFSLSIIPIVCFWKAVHIHGTPVPRDFMDKCNILQELKEDRQFYYNM